MTSRMNYYHCSSLGYLYGPHFQEEHQESNSDDVWVRGFHQWYVGQKMSSSEVNSLEKT